MTSPDVLPGLSNLGVSINMLGSQPFGFGWLAWLKLEPVCSDVTLADDETPVRIMESGSVPVLICENLTETPLVIPEHFICVGGLQTRTVERTVIIPPKTKVTIPVKCVEAGRWSPRSHHESYQFTLKGRLSLKTRFKVRENMLRRFEVFNNYEAEQGEVWASVDRELHELRLNSQTRSYEDVLSKKNEIIPEDKIEQIEVPVHANGLITCTATNLIWVECFPRRKNIERFKKILLSDLLDTYVNEEKKLEEEPDFSKPISKILNAPLKRAPDVPGCLGETYIVSENGCIGQVTMLDGKVVHASFHITMGLN